MRIPTIPFISFLIALTTGSAFVPSNTAFSRRTVIFSQKSNQNHEHAPSFRFDAGVIDSAKKIATAAMLSTLIWTSPATLISGLNDMSTHPSYGGFLDGVTSAVVANAKEKASGSGARVNKDPESLLRYSLPIKNKEVRELQTSIEGIKTDVTSKRKAAAIDGVKKSRTIIKSKASKMTAACRDPSVCSSVLESISSSLAPLETSVKESQDVLNGSEQERTALDAAKKVQAQISDEINVLEEQMIPAGYQVVVPDDYSDLPQLQGRATIEFELKKEDGAPFDIEGVNYPKATIKMVIDGYAAPVTAGNFIDLVNKDFYKGMKIQRSDGFVVQTGKPEGEADGYVGKPSKSVGAGKHGERLIPNEIFPLGDKGPFYESSIEDEGRGGEAVVLPFSSFGAMGWAREEYDVNSGSSQFFWLLFDSDLTPAGKNVLDGRYPCFGVAVEGADFLRDTKEGDIIVSTKILSGLENLKMPQ